MKHAFQNLSAKLVGILTLYMLVALTAIGLTLVVSWQLEGGAAAINDAGSERMHSYRMAYLLSEAVRAGPGTADARQALAQEMAAFEQTLRGLERGDPARPLVVPDDPGIRAQLAAVRRHWRDRIKPAIAAIVASRGGRSRRG